MGDRALNEAFNGELRLESKALVGKPPEDQLPAA